MYGQIVHTKIIYAENTLLAEGCSHYSYEVIKMDLREALKAVSSAGTPISILARNVGKSPSTVNKWINGSNKYLAQETQEKLIDEVYRIKELWANIDIER